MVVWLSDGRPFTGFLRGYDEAKDLAILLIHADTLPSLSPMEQPRLALGDEVLAFGYPLGGNLTVTKGIVSAFGTFSDSGLPYIQTDAAINPGSSGGALVDLAGNLVGITRSRTEIDAGRVVQNIGYAITLSGLANILEQIKQGKIIAKPTPAVAETRWLGSTSHGFRIQIPLTWQYMALPVESYDYLHRRFLKGDWLIWQEKTFPGPSFSIVSIRVDAEAGSAHSYTPVKYLEKEQRFVERNQHVKVRVESVKEIKLANGTPAIRAQWKVDYYTDVVYKVVEQGVWSSTWIVATLEDTTVALESLTLGDFGKDCTDAHCEKAVTEMEQALESFQAFTAN